MRFLTQSFLRVNIKHSLAIEADGLEDETELGVVTDVLVNDLKSEAGQGRVGADVLGDGDSDGVPVEDRELVIDIRDDNSNTGGCLLSVNSVRDEFPGPDLYKRQLSSLFDKRFSAKNNPKAIVSCDTGSRAAENYITVPLLCIYILSLGMLCTVTG